jgi:hypothetical protein
MKKLFLSLLLFLITAPCFAGVPQILQTMERRNLVAAETIREGYQVYAGTEAALRFASVDGGAMVDGFVSAEALALFDGNNLLEIYDSASKVMKAYPVVGTGETLGDALNVSNCANSGFDTFSDTSPTGFTAAEVSGTAIAGTADEILFTGGCLYKATFNLAKTGGIFPTSSSGVALGGALWGNAYTTSEGANTHYWTSLNSDLGVGVYQFYIITNSTSFAVSSLAVKKVTAPSASGATLFNSKGGATQNILYKDSAFSTTGPHTMRVYKVY